MLLDQRIDVATVLFLLSIAVFVAFAGSSPIPLLSSGQGAALTQRLLGLHWLDSSSGLVGRQQWVSSVRSRAGALPLWARLIAGFATVAGVSLLVLVLVAGDERNPVAVALWVLSLIGIVLVAGMAPPLPGVTPFQRAAVAANSRVHSNRLETLALVGILVLAAVLRLANIEYHPGIMGDEGERGVQAIAILRGAPISVFVDAWAGVPTLYFHLVALFLRVFGETMLGARALSILSGLLAVWIVYLVGRENWNGRVGLFAAAFLATNPLALQFSRVASESTPTGTLWAGGFLFLFRGLRTGSWKQFALTGVCWGLSLYFYASGKLIIPIAVVVAAYCLLRWARWSLVRYLPGFALAAIAAALVFAPYGVHSAKTNWEGFAGRAAETSVLSPQNRVAAFTRRDLQFDPEWAADSIPVSVLSHPLNWAALMGKQIWITGEVLYRNGDPTAMYQIHEHGGSMMPVPLAALTILGVAYAVSRFWDPRCGLLVLWFLGGLMGAALTLDTPSVQRIVGAWVPVMLFPALALDRGVDLWSRMARWGRVPASVVAVVLIALIGVLSVWEYFVHYSSTCVYCDGTTPARFVQAVGPTARVYQLGVGDPLVSFGYGTTRFVANSVEGMDLPLPGDEIPVRAPANKDAVFIVYPHNSQYVTAIERFYTPTSEEEVYSADGIKRFTSVVVAASEVRAHQGTHARYGVAPGPVMERDEHGIGTAPEGASEWTPPAGLRYPVEATWEGTLFVPLEGAYSLKLNGPANANVELDGLLAMTADQRQVDLVLARGPHLIKLVATLPTPSSRVDVCWGPSGGACESVASELLFAGRVGGLTGEVKKIAPADAARDWEAIPVGAEEAFRVDHLFGFRHARSAFGDDPFVAIWHGQLEVPTSGVYDFKLAGRGRAQLSIDELPPLELGGTATPTGELKTSSRSFNLPAGQHTVMLRYLSVQGLAEFEWYWKPPGVEDASLVPSTALGVAPDAWVSASERPEAKPGRIH